MVSSSDGISELGEAGSLLDQLLVGRSAEFKARVYELVVRYQWDVNDPSFAILVATGQMELLLAEFPEQFEDLFESLLLRLQAQSQGLQDWFTGEKGDLKELIRGLETQQSQESEMVQGRIKEFSDFIQGQRQWTEKSVDSVLTVAQEKREQMFDEVKDKLYQERTDLLRKVQSETNSWLNAASKSWELTSIRNMMIGAATTAAVVFGIGMVYGIIFYQGIIEPLIGVPEARQILKWNRDQLQECRKVKRTTCNFHIVDPQK